MAKTKAIEKYQQMIQVLSKFDSQKYPEDDVKEFVKSLKDVYMSIQNQVTNAEYYKELAELKKKYGMK